MIEIRLPEPEGFQDGDFLTASIDEDGIRYVGKSRTAGEWDITRNDIGEFFRLNYPSATTHAFLRWQAAVSAEILKQYEEQTI